MKKLFTLLAAVFLTYASFAVLPIMGTMGVCAGSSTGLFDSTSGGVWSSSNVAVGTVLSMGTSATVTGITPGTTIISYTVGGVSVTGVFVVNPVPAAIGGPHSVCVGSTITLTDATSGGVWMSYYSYATVGSASGVVTGVSSGLDEIEYVMGTGCEVTYSVAVGGAGTVAPIVGDSTVCAGSTVTFTDATGGGVWTSSNTAIATVGSGSGVVSGVATGAATISYSVTGTCGTVTETYMVYVPGTTSAGTITGSSTVGVTATTTLTDGVSGGTWSSSNTSIATVSGGVVTGIATGTATITYTVTGVCGGPVYTTFVITVTPFDGISGYVIFTSGGAYSGDVKVWLITYNTTTHDLEAMDSTVVFCAGDSVYYQFTGVATDSFRIKASVNEYDSMLTTGYIPTYHTSSFYWYSANVLYHTSGTGDTHQDINMSYGAVTSGTGFISGDVLTGANRGTSGAAPAVGLLMICENAAGNVIQQTQTNSTGNYTFSNLGTGTYRIHAEAINYVSTDYTSITLSTSTPSMSAANFIQHTISHTITPGTTAVTAVTASNSSVVAFPNPTNGMLNIKWNENVTENGTVTISDITGREVYKSTVNMTQGAGVNQVDLSNLTNGLYIINVTSGNINYNNKIQVQH